MPQFQSTFCNLWNLSHLLIEKVPFDKWHLLSKLSYTIFKEKGAICQIVPFVTK